MTQMDVLANTMLRIKAEYLWEAAAICRKTFYQSHFPLESDYGIGCHDCEVALQKLARELDPMVGGGA